MHKDMLRSYEHTIAVFAYSFSHKKTYDFLTFLKFCGFDNVCVIAAPKVKLDSRPHNKLFSRLPSAYPDIKCEELCVRLDYKFIELAHSDVKRIASFLTKNNCLEFAIVSGARILNEDIISLFNQGIINFHPGKIPETSGLDSFYWMIKNNVLPGTTVHYIDHKVDAGQLVFFHNCSISEEDTPQTLEAKLYDNQLSALIRLLKLLKYLPVLKIKPLVRPAKNLPMTEQQQIDVLELFTSWKETILPRQYRASRIFHACEVGNLFLLKKYFKSGNNHLLNNSGWTPMIVAAYNQHLDCLKYLISKNEDVNATNDKGTSVLMYAKTKLMNVENPNLNLLKELISAGANKKHKDLFEKNIFQYLEESNNFDLSKSIKEL